MFPILWVGNEVSAYGYLISRSIEAVMLAVGTVYLLLLIPLGLFGYPALLVGSVFEIFGYRVGNALSAPGGLFEVALGVLLIARGFASQAGDATALPAGSENNLSYTAREPVRL